MEIESTTHVCVTSGSDIIQYLHVVSRTMYLITENMHKVVKVWTVANVRIRSMCLSSSLKNSEPTAHLSGHCHDTRPSSSSP